MARGTSRTEFHTGQQIRESGIYRVIHAQHRLPHEVTLLRGAKFPRCSKCKNAVRFEAISLAPGLDSIRERVTLYELPPLNEEAA